MQFQIVQIRPDGYAHSGGLNEFAEGVCHGIRRLGIAAYYDETPLEPARRILIGAHLLRDAELAAVPADAIIYNSEQVTGDSPWFGRPYLALLKNREVWDYSAQNADRLTDLGVAAKYVPIGYVPELCRIPHATEDIDVLFYGSMNPRRRAIIEALQQRGLNVQALFGVYGEERDRAIARAKIVLSLHFYDSKVLETVRVAYLLTNAKAVVAECGPDTAIPPGLRDAIRGVRYEELADACIELAADEKARRELAERGHRLFSQHTAEEALAVALGRRRATPPGDPRAVGLPATLHLGSGKDFRQDCFNIDIDAAWGPDAVVDIAAPDLLGRSVVSKRHGAVLLGAECFQEIVANDVLEHISDLVSAMSNCLKLLRAGGIFRIAVPYDLGLGAWQDPTHIRAFNENSWLYYTDWHWYLGWQEMRFDLLSLEFQTSALGIELIQGGRPTPEVMRTPRAVEAMRVVLRKRYLQPSERRAAAARQPRRQQ